MVNSGDSKYTLLYDGVLLYYFIIMIICYSVFFFLNSNESTYEDLLLSVPKVKVEVKVEIGIMKFWNTNVQFNKQGKVQS